MKINSITPKDLYGVYSKTQASSAQAAPESAQTDKVELSQEAKIFSTAMRAAKEAMETDGAARRAHIETIKQQIEDGTYAVSGEAIAQKMLGLTE